MTSIEVFTIVDVLNGALRNVQRIGFRSCARIGQGLHKIEDVDQRATHETARVALAWAGQVGPVALELVQTLRAEGAVLGSVECANEIDALLVATPATLVEMEAHLHALLALMRNEIYRLLAADTRRTG